MEKKSIEMNGGHLDNTQFFLYIRQMMGIEGLLRQNFKIKHPSDYSVSIGV